MGRFDQEGVQAKVRTVYDARREHERYEDMSAFDQFLADEYEAEKQEERADRYEEETARQEEV